MPAVSRAQRVAMAIAEHTPDKLFKRNAGLKQMSHSQLSEFASTKEKGLPQYTKASPARAKTAAAIFKHKAAAKKGKY